MLGYTIQRGEQLTLGVADVVELSMALLSSESNQQTDKQTISAQCVYKSCLQAYYL